MFRGTDIGRRKGGISADMGGMNTAKQIKKKKREKEPVACKQGAGRYA